MNTEKKLNDLEDRIKNIESTLFQISKDLHGPKIKEKIITTPSNNLENSNIRDFNIFDNNKLYRISEIANQIGRPRDNVFRELKKMKIPHTKLNPEGRTQLYLCSDINKVLRLNRSED